LEIEEVQRLHERSLKAYGGTAGVRDFGLVESAVDQPKNDFYYANADLFGIAAAYAFHIAQAQAFLDGNKRTALTAAMTFLEMHGIDTTCDWRILHDAMIAIAEKRLDKAGLAQRFREVFPPAQA
jgi:death-on-curing protein